MRQAKLNDASRIRQGVLSGTSKSGLDEALKVIRGNPPTSSSRKNLFDVSSSTASSREYKVVHPIRVESNSVKKPEPDLSATWAAMLQTAELKSSLEAKIQMLSNQINNLKMAHVGKSDMPPLQGSLEYLNTF